MVFVRNVGMLPLWGFCSGGVAFCSVLGVGFGFRVVFLLSGLLVGVVGVAGCAVVGLVTVSQSALRLF